MPYFRERKLTIIGAILFHGPVREGKGWVQKAIAAKRNLCALSDVLRAKLGGRLLCCDCGFACINKVIGSSRTGN